MQDTHCFFKGKSNSIFMEFFEFTTRKNKAVILNNITVWAQIHQAPQWESAQPYAVQPFSLIMNGIFTSQLIVWITVSGVIKSFALPWFTQLRRGASIFSLCLCCSSDLPKHLPGLSCGNHIWPLPRSVRKGPSLLFQTCIKLISVGVWENENGRAVYNFSGVLIWALLLILFYKKMTSQR